MRSLVSIVELASWRIRDSGTVVRLTTYTELAGWLPWLRQARPAQLRRGNRKAERNHKSASSLTFHNWVLFHLSVMGTKQGKERNPGVQLGKQNRGKSKSGYDVQIREGLLSSLCIVVTRAYRYQENFVTCPLISMDEIKDLT